MLRFHPKHGAHVDLSECRTVATRNKSFANAVVFSHRPLSTLETFMFEIIDQEQGWSGHVRCGVTSHNPKDFKLRVPLYLLPDLAQMGKTWVFALKPNNSKPLGDEHLRDDGSHNFSRVEDGDEDTNQLYCGEKALKENLKPTDKGSRIGVRISSCGHLYFYINGKKFGPCASNVPQNIYAAVDVYGSTKSVKIVQCGAISYTLFANVHFPRDVTTKECRVPTLLNLCCYNIKIATKDRNLDDLPIPKLLIKYVASF